MPLSVMCPTCGTKLKAPDSAAGRKAKCSKCGGRFLVPEAPRRANSKERMAPASEQPPGSERAARQPVTLEEVPSTDQLPPASPGPLSQNGRGMKLIIKRDQKAHTGLFGGHKGMIFVLDCRVVLTPDEHKLIEKYKADHFLASPPRNEAGEPMPGLKTNVACYTPSLLLAGVHHECKDIAVLLQTEEIIKEACRNFKTYLAVMATFGGEEIIEF